MNPLKDLLARRLLIVMGKGGVGKTAISAALSVLAASQGIQTLAMECDGRGPLGSLFATSPSLDPVAVSPKLSMMVLDGRHSLEEYLQIVVPVRLIFKAVFASKLYQYFVQAAPGLRELMMLGKIYFEIAQKKPAAARPELIVLDAPASGQALSLLKMPAAARSTFGNSIVGRESSHINRLLHDERQCAIVLVATPERLALNETMETKLALAGAGFSTTAIILNRSSTLTFDENDVALFKSNPELRRRISTLDHLSAIASAGPQRYRAARDAISALTKDSEVPVIQIPDYRGLCGESLVGAIVDALGDIDAHDVAKSI
jgi:anion-transporting  ArsA/GET3 family ATPase